MIFVHFNKTYPRDIPRNRHFLVSIASIAQLEPTANGNEPTNTSGNASLTPSMGVSNNFNQIRIFVCFETLVLAIQRSSLTRTFCFVHTVE